MAAGGRQNFRPPKSVPVGVNDTGQLDCRETSGKHRLGTDDIKSSTRVASILLDGSQADGSQYADLRLRSVPGYHVVSLTWRNMIAHDIPSRRPTNDTTTPWLKERSHVK